MYVNWITGVYNMDDAWRALAEAHAEVHALRQVVSENLNGGEGYIYDSEGEAHPDYAKRLEELKQFYKREYYVKDKDGTATTN